MILLLFGCMGSLHSSEGSDRIRGALWFAGRESELNGTASEGEGATTPNAALVILANSTLPCEPEQVESSDDGLDQAAAAEQYWGGQVLSAFSREGAIVVLLGLYTWSDGLSGDYAISENALQDHLDLLAAEPRVGFGAWVRVNESAVDETYGMFSTYAITDIDYEPAAGAASEVSVAVRGNPEDEVADGETLTGDFVLEPSGMSGAFRAERCDNRTLYNHVVAQVVALQYLLQ